MKRWVQSIIVAVAGIVGGVVGFSIGFFPIVYLFAPYDVWVGVTGIIGIFFGFLTGALGAMRSGEVVGKFLERYD